MKKRIYPKIGLALIILGILVVNLESFLLITGAVVGVSRVVARTSFWTGLVFIIGGFVLVLAAKPKAKNLVEISKSGVEIIPTDRFLGSIRGVNLNKINAALKKIGSGLGRQHTLTTKSHSVSVGRSGRIDFNYNPANNTATLQNYGGGHDYDKILRHRR